jgi:hypothetical protein
MGFSSDKFTWTLLALYVALWLVCLVQIGRIWYYKHNLRSFQAGFMYLASAFCFLRVIYFLALCHVLPSYDEGSLTACALLEVAYHLPLVFQFAMHTLLVSFFGYMCYRSEWPSMRWKFRLFVWSVNTLWVLVFVVNLGFRLGHQCHELDSSLSGRLHHACNGMLMLLVIAALTKQAVKLARGARVQLGQPTSAASQAPTYPHSLRGIAALTVVLDLILVSRALYNFLTAISDTFEASQSDTTDLLVFSCMTVWEVIPSVSVLLFFQIPSTKLGARRFFSRRDRGDAGAPILGESTSALSDTLSRSTENADAGARTSVSVSVDGVGVVKPPVHSVFRNRDRYDTDSEAHSFMGSFASTSATSYTQFHQRHPQFLDSLAASSFPASASYYPDSSERSILTFASPPIVCGQ